MDVTMGKRTVACRDKIFEYRDTREEAVETVVPDTMPDIERILCADGTVTIRSKEAGMGTVSLSAAVAANVVYVPEDGCGARRLDAVIPFSVTADAPGVTPESVPVARLTLMNVEARMLNPRKVVIRASLHICLEGYNACELTFCQGPEDGGAVRTLERAASVFPVVWVGEKTFVVTDEYRTPAGGPEMGELMRAAAELFTDEVKCIGTRLVLKGRARVSALYARADTGELESAVFETAFSQLMETECSLSAPDSSMSLLLTAAYLEPATLAGGEKGLSCELHVVAQNVCTDSVDITYLADCYSTRRALSVATDARRHTCGMRRAAARTMLQQQLETPQTVSEVRMVSCHALEGEYRDGSVRCAVSAALLFKDDSGAPQGLARRIMAEQPLELEEGWSVVSVSAVCGEAYAVPSGKSVELRLPVDFSVLICREEELRQITGITISEEGAAPERPSLTLVRPEAGTSLWELAKRHGSSREAIMELNSLEDEGAAWGRVLLIPAEK